MPPSKEHAAIAQRLIDGAKIIFANAEALYTEATILANNQAWARALLLHQISLEECAKVDMLGAAVTSLLMGHDVDVKRLQKSFARHEVKNKANAYFLPMSEGEKVAQTNGDLAGALEEFRRLQAEFHKESNTDKNSALYVDFGDKFISPLDVINEEAFVKVRTRNDDFLSSASLHVRLMDRLAADLDAAAGEVKELLDALGILTIDRKDPKQFRAFFDSYEDKLLEIARKRKAPTAKP